MLYLYFSWTFRAYWTSAENCGLAMADPRIMVLSICFHDYFIL
jgi:hypothetical protein